MTQPQRLFSFFLVIGALHFHCSSPSSSSAAISWHAKYCMPLLNMKMNVHDILTGNQKPSQNLDLDSLHCGDTLQLLYTDTLKTAMKSTIYTVHDTNYQYRLGTLTLRNLPPATVTLKMIDTFISSIPLPKPLSVNLNGETTIPHLEYIQIDESSDSISISIENLSDAVTFDYLIIASLSRADTIVALRIDTPLRPHERIDQKFSGAGKTIFNTINNSISVQVAQGSIIDRSTALKLSLHLNNQTLNEACLSDIYLKYSFSTIIPLALKKDSCIIHYCDVTSLNIPITINNGTPIDFTLNYGIENVFNADYCRSNTIDSIGSLKNMVVDSSWYLGKSLAPVTIAGTGDPATPTETPIPIRFSNARFLPRWNDKGLVSECALFFQVQLRPSGRMIKINKQNSFSLATQDSRIEFSELDCRYKFDKKFFGKPIRLKLPASAPLTLFPQLRQRLTLIKTGLHLNARFEIPDHTTLELIRGECILQALTPAVAVSDTFNQNFHRISQNMSTSFSFNPTSIINAFPDSVDYIFNYTIPREKHLRFAQGVLINEPQRSFLAIPVQVPVTLSLSFIWEIRDSIRVDLKPLSLPLTLNVSTLELLSEKKVSFDYTLFNQTNINGRIFGLAATTKQKSMLNGLTPEQITPQSLGGCKKTSSENHDNVIQDLIPIFGYHGIILPGRGQTNPAAITLDEAMVRQITDSDSLFIRWNFLLPPTKADCLIDTDYIAVDAGISLEGTQSIGESNR